MGLIKNMEPEQVLNLAQQVAVRPGEIVRELWHRIVM